MVDLLMILGTGMTASRAVEALTDAAKVRDDLALLIDRELERLAGA
ncbi:hypothetical protein AB5I41_14150 [Sphingomonas sp. MMS24-JH45]